LAVLALFASSDALAQKKKPKKKKQQQEVQLNLDSLAEKGVGEGPGIPVDVIKKDSPSDPDMYEFIDVDSSPEMIDNIGRFIVYPVLASRNNIEGKVVISLLIDEKGNVTKTHIESSSNQIFDQATIDAAQKVKFTPASRNGKAVKVWYTLPVNFRLNN
jgi:TonB family protein